MPKTSPTTSPPSAAELVASFVSEIGGGRRVGRQIQQMSPEEVVPHLAEALAAAKKRGAFERLGRLLAAIGDEAAFQALAQEARVRKRYPHLAPRMLALCKHPGAEAALLDLMARGQGRQRFGAALALARTRLLRAIELCAAGYAASNDEGRLLLQALRHLGNWYAITLRVLEEPGHDAPARLRALTALETLPEGFRLIRYKLDRALQYYAQTQYSQTSPSLRAVTELRTAQRTLLRAAEAQPDGTLLRPASGPGDTPDERLLRASSAEDVPAEPAARGWWARLWQRLSGNGQAQEE